MARAMRNRSRSMGTVVRALVAAGSVAIFAGCGSPGTTGTATGLPAGSHATVEPSAATTPGSSSTVSVSEIPPGRAISDGGGPAQYTFREEWRRALAAARQWRSGAYLINASGNQVNDQGVPSYWIMAFIDKAAADAVFRIEIDPWGKVTRTNEITGSSVTSFVDEFTTRIPYDVIDSDQVVTVAAAALGAKYDLAKTSDPAVAIGSTAVSGGELRWTYMLLYSPTADYVSVAVDPTSGEITPLE